MGFRVPLRVLAWTSWYTMIPVCELGGIGGYTGLCSSFASWGAALSLSYQSSPKHTWATYLKVTEVILNWPPVAWPHAMCLC